MFTGEVDFVVDQEKESREKIYRQQEALQEPGAINKFLEEITDLSSRVASANLEDFELIKLRAKEIVDINVGVVENPDVYLQGEVNNEVSKLVDEIFKREHPKVYALALEALLQGLPQGIDIYNGQEIRNRLFLASMEQVLSRLRSGLISGRWQIVAGIKPVRSSVLSALRNADFGESQLERYGEFEELESRLEKFEEEIGNDFQKQEIFKDYITNRHDRVRCRVYTNTRFNLNLLMGDVRYRAKDLVNVFLGKSAEWNYYMSKWLYKGTGEVFIEDKEDRGGPNSSPGYFLREATNLKPDDLVYAAWHAQLKFKPVFCKKVPVEVQVFPVEFASMHNMLQGIFIKDNPDISAVSPVLRKKANNNAKKYLRSE